MRHTRLERFEDGGHDGAGDVGGDAVNGASLLVDERCALDSPVLPRVDSSYSPRNVSASFDHSTSFVRASVKAPSSSR